MVALNLTAATMIALPSNDYDASEDLDLNVSGDA